MKQPLILKHLRKSLVITRTNLWKTAVGREVYDKGYKIDELALTVTVVGSVRFKTVPTAISFGNELQIASSTTQYPIVSMDQPLVIRDTRQTGNNWSLALTVTSDFKSESGATLPNILKFRTNHRLQDIPEGQSILVHNQANGHQETNISDQWKEMTKSCYYLFLEDGQSRRIRSKTNLALDGRT